MSHTVVGVFDTSSEAQTALQTLVKSGISRDRIDIAPQTSSDTTRSGDREDEDSISSFFSNLFGSDDDRSKRYSTHARSGAIVTVHASSAQEAERAADILDDNGAVNLDERPAGTNTGTYGSTAGATGQNINQDINRRDTTSSDTTIPIIEENMQVGKRTVETGGVRVRSHIVERPIEEHLRLREEHVNVERNPVNRPASAQDLNSFKEGEIKLTEHAEVPVVNKEARVVEEVRIHTDVNEHDENITGTVRKTDVEIDNLTEEELRRNRTEGDNRLDNDRDRNLDNDRNRNL